jgi:hypothetical protein
MTQRIFKLKGVLPNNAATGTVTINGTEVFNGAFSVGADGEPDGFLCEFAYTFDDSAGTDTTFPVVVTVATGQALVGMFKYNYVNITNPLLTPEELVYVTTNTIADAPANIKSDVAAKGGWYVRDETAFDYGITPPLCFDNRTNEILDGVALPEEDGHLYITVREGSTLTFNTIVFSSVNPPTTP